MLFTGGATVLKVGYNFATGASENFLTIPTFCLPEGHETEHCAFHYCNYDV